jgi:hypothetical protein
VSPPEVSDVDNRGDAPVPQVSMSHDQLSCVKQGMSPDGELNCSTA